MSANTLKPAAAPGKAASGKPRLGFLGVGWIGANRLGAIAASGLSEIVALADPNEALLHAASAHAPGAACLHSLGELLTSGLDGVVIATPSAQHAAQAMEALGSGLAVFCQKPLGRNAAEVREVLLAARAADRLLAVDLSYRFTDALRKVRELVRSGELGRIFAVNLVFHNAYGPGKSWFYDPRHSGGGCLIDLGIHLIDAALWILDQPIRRVRSQLFRGGEALPPKPAVCEDYAEAHCVLADGATVNLACSWGAHAGRGAVIEASFYGTKGAAIMRNQRGSFFDFTAEHGIGDSSVFLSTPPDEWGGRAAVDWVERLSSSHCYDPAVDSIQAVAEALDTIYNLAGEP